MIIATPKLSHRVIFFTCIGITSALVHLLVVLNLVNLIQLNPLIANIFAFLIAFNISFWGHKYLTFAQMENQKKLRLPHFFLVAVSAGILNESMYFLILYYTELNYLLALILVLGFVSIYSFLSSKFWACR